MLTKIFDYKYPEELVAQTPCERRDGSRLMVVDPAECSVSHSRFSEIGDWLRPGDCLVVNDTRVIPARLIGRKESGGRAELLLLRRLDGDTWEALAKPAKRLRTGSRMSFGAGLLEAEVTVELEAGRRQVALAATGLSVREAIEKVGQVPLPPYIHNASVEAGRYQTIYARRGASVAAPTAGLHFTDSLLSELRERGVDVAHLNLDVGLATFRPIESETIERHAMHTERFEVSRACAESVMATKRRGGRVVAVGTTTVRALESVSDESGLVSPTQGETDLYITPGYRFRCVDAMVTNFHLPRSTLLVMVSAFAGLETTRRAYGEAIAGRYRLFSFGDAMFITAQAAP